MIEATKNTPPKLLLNTLFPSEGSLARVWNSIQIPDLSKVTFESLSSKAWEVLKQASESFSAITFLFFRTLQLIAPSLVFAIEIPWLYLNATYTNHENRTLTKANKELSDTLASVQAELSLKTDQLKAAELLTTQVKEEAAKAATDLTKAQFDHAQLQATKDKVERDFQGVSNLLHDLDAKYKALTSEYLALKKISSRSPVFSEDYTKIFQEVYALAAISKDADMVIKRDIFFKQALPPLLTWASSEKTILQTEMGMLSPEQISARDAMAHGCEIFDNFIVNLKAFMTPTPSTHGKTHE